MQHEFGLCLVSCLTFDKAVNLPRFRYLVSKMKIIIPAFRESVGHTRSLYLNRTSTQSSGQESGLFDQIETAGPTGVSNYLCNLRSSLTSELLLFPHYIG